MGVVTLKDSRRLIFYIPSFTGHLDFVSHSAIISLEGIEDSKKKKKKTDDLRYNFIKVIFKFFCFVVVVVVVVVFNSALPNH